MTHRNGLRRTALWIGVTFAAFASLPAVANAATVGTDGTTIEYTAALGETNQTAIVASGTDIVFTDAGASSLVDGDGAGGCSVSGGVATCPLTSFVATHVTLAAGADTLGATGNLAPLTQLTVDAGSGADTVNGGNGADILLGGGGNDTIDGNQGADTVLAGTGNDTMQWDPGDAQRHARGPGQPRHAALQRLGHRRADRRVGERRPGPADPRHRGDHDGPQRRRGRHRALARRRRHDHGQRPQRHRRDRVHRRPVRHRRRRRRRGRPGDRQRDQRGRQPGRRGLRRGGSGQRARGHTPRSRTPTRRATS